MSRRSIVELVVALDLAALSILASVLLAGLGQQPALLVLFCGLAAAVSIRPIRVRAIKLQLAPSDAFVFAALANLGPLAAVLTALMANLVAAAGGGQRKAVVRLAFNSGTAVLAVASAWWVFSALGARAGGHLEQAILPLSAAATVFLLVNSLLVSAPISIERRTHYLATLLEIVAWTGPTVLVGLLMALAITAVIGLASVWILLIAVVPCWILAFVYRIHVEHRGLSGHPSSS